MLRLTQLAHPSDAKLLSVLSDAVRDAALASSDREALDIAGAALAHAVSLVKFNSNCQSEAIIGRCSLNRLS